LQGRRIAFDGPRRLSDLSCTPENSERRKPAVPEVLLANVSMGGYRKPSVDVNETRCSPLLQYQTTVRTTAILCQRKIREILMSRRCSAARGPGECGRGGGLPGMLLALSPPTAPEAGNGD